MPEGSSVANYAAVGDRCKTVALEPPPRVVLGPNVDLAGLEGFEQRGGVAEVLDADLLEVEPPAHDGQVAGPPVGIAAVGDGAAGIDPRHHVGPAAHGRLERRALERGRIELVARQDRHQPEQQRSLAVARQSEGEAHAAVADLLGRRHLAVVRAVIEPALLLEERVAEQNVLGRNRTSVGEPGFGPEVERDERAIGGELDALRNQAVERERLVAAARHQALEHVLAQARRRDAPVDEGVEAVEAAQHAENEAAAAGSVRVHIGKVADPGGMLWCAVHGKGVQRLRRRSRRRTGRQRRQQGADMRHFVQAREAGGGGAA
jgi:hypothetical protein